MVEFWGESEPKDKVVEYFVCHCFARFVSRRIGLGKPGEMVRHHQDVLVSPNTFSRWTKSMETISNGAVVTVG